MISEAPGNSGRGTPRGSGGEPRRCMNATAACVSRRRWGQTQPTREAREIRVKTLRLNGALPGAPTGRFRPGLDSELRPRPVEERSQEARGGGKGRVGFLGAKAALAESPFADPMSAGTHLTGPSPCGRCGMDDRRWGQARLDPSPAAAHQARAAARDPAARGARQRSRTVCRKSSRYSSQITHCRQLVTPHPQGIAESGPQA